MRSQKASDELSTREKKIATKRIATLSVAQMADIWKVNKDKALSPKDKKLFDLMRVRYKSEAGVELPKHSSDLKGVK